MKKCVVISSTNYYDVRIKKILDYYNSVDYETYYITSSVEHFSKGKSDCDYKNLIKVPVVSYNKNISVKRLYSHYSFAKKVKKIVSNIKPDLVYCIVPPNSLVKSMAKYKKGTKTNLIFDCFDMWPESFPYHTKNKLIKWAFKKWANLRDDYITAADRVVCVSKVAEDKLKSYNSNLPTRVLYPCLEQKNALARDGYSLDTISICYLGMINHITDTEFAVKLLSLLRKQKKVLFHLIGEGQNKQQFLSQLKDNDIDVVEHGLVFNDDEKNKIFSFCDFGLNIPRKEINSSMPLKGVEYLRFGLPVINSSKGDFCEIIAKDELGINVDNVENLDVEMFVDKTNLLQMRKNCVCSYKKRFVDQEFTSILSI